MYRGGGKKDRLLCNEDNKQWQEKCCRKTNGSGYPWEPTGKK